MTDPIYRDGETPEERAAVEEALRLVLGDDAVDADEELLPLTAGTFADELRPLPTDPPKTPAPVRAARTATRALLPTLPEEEPGLDLTQVTVPIDVSALLTPEKPKRTTSGPRAKKEASADELGYRFPYSRIILEPVADESGGFITGTFAVRLAWHRGKAVLPLIESSPLRPLAQVTLNGQKYPIYLNQHSRKRRDRLVLGGKRKTAKPARCLLRVLAFVEGREDKLSWEWYIGATSAAIAYHEKQRADAPDQELPPDAVLLQLPFVHGKTQVITQEDAPGVLALWLHDVVLTVAAGHADGVQPGYTTTPELTHDSRGFYLSLTGVNLAGHGTILRWETWFAPARTEAEVRTAILAHAADIADRLQLPDAAWFGGELLGIQQENTAQLLREDLTGKRGSDKAGFYLCPGNSQFSVGVGTDAALACAAILARFFCTGDDALRRRARLVSRGVCDFQITIEESPHWGAIWDAQQKKKYSDYQGENTLSVTTTARAATGLLFCHSHFETPILERTALAAAQWLLLKLDSEGLFPAERFFDNGPPVDGTYSPWIAVEALIPLVEAFRVTQNEVFLKTAQRTIATLKAGLASRQILLESATAEQLATAVEGVLLVSREYESEELIALAKQLLLGLRSRRRPDGTLVATTVAENTLPPHQRLLLPTLAGARAALAICRVDHDPQHLLMAFRAVRAAGRRVQQMTAAEEFVPIAIRAALIQHSLGVLLTVGQRIKDAKADRDRIQLKRGWQTFGPDPATQEFLQVTTIAGEPVDYLPLVCPVSFQVLIIVLAPPSITELKVVKNGKVPFLKSLLTGEVDIRARLIPLGDGAEANIGVFIADT